MARSFAVLALLGPVLLLVFTGIKWFGLDQGTPFSRDPYDGLKVGPSGILFTKAELSAFDGADEGKPLLLGYIGSVYDVTKGAKFYNKADGHYTFFIGVDASRAFVTGDFSEKGLIDTLDGLNDHQLVDLVGWEEFYATEYPLVGRVVGEFYNEVGEPTQVMQDLPAKVAESKARIAANLNEKALRPLCEIDKSDAANGNFRVFCHKSSGGVERSWGGVPRQILDVVAGTATCKCVHPMSPHTKDMKVYPGCDRSLPQCVLPLDKWEELGFR